MILGIDAVIEVVLVKIFENPRAYSIYKLKQAYKLVKSALLCYIDEKIDINYIQYKISEIKKGQSPTEK